MPKPRAKDGLTSLQRNFVACFESNGFKDVEQSAMDAGYSVSYAKSISYKLLDNTGVKEAIAKRKAIVQRLAIANRKDRQSFWTATMANERASMADRLRASELLGRSEADFTDNLNTADKTKAIELTEREQAEARRLAGIRLRQPAEASRQPEAGIQLAKAIVG